MTPLALAGGFLFALRRPNQASRFARIRSAELLSPIEAGMPFVHQGFLRVASAVPIIKVADPLHNAGQVIELLAGVNQRVWLRVHLKNRTYLTYSLVFIMPSRTILILCSQQFSTNKLRPHCPYDNAQRQTHTAPSQLLISAPGQVRRH